MMISARKSASESKTMVAKKSAPKASVKANKRPRDSNGDESHPKQTTKRARLDVFDIDSILPENVHENAQNPETNPAAKKAARNQKGRNSTAAKKPNPKKPAPASKKPTNTASATRDRAISEEQRSQQSPNRTLSPPADMDLDVDAAHTLLNLGTLSAPSAPELSTAVESSQVEAPVRVTRQQISALAEQQAPQTSPATRTHTSDKAKRSQNILEPPVANMSKRKSLAVRKKTPPTKTSSTIELETAAPANKQRREHEGSLVESNKNQDISRAIRLELQPIEPPKDLAKAFFGSGQDWNQLLAHRELLLARRPEILRQPPPWLTELKDATIYPRTKKAEALRKNLVTLEEYLDTTDMDVKHTAGAVKLIINKVVGTKRKGKDKPEQFQADLCHLIIPQIIRLIGATYNKYWDDDNLGNVPFEIVWSLTKLFQYLADVSDRVFDIETTAADQDLEEKLGVSNELATPMEGIKDLSVKLSVPFRRELDSRLFQRRREDLVKAQRKRQEEEQFREARGQRRREDIRKKLEARFELDKQKAEAWEIARVEEMRLGRRARAQRMEDAARLRIEQAARVAKEIERLSRQRQENEILKERARKSQEDEIKKQRNRMRRKFRRDGANLATATAVSTEKSSSPVVDGHWEPDGIAWDEHANKALLNRLYQFQDLKNVDRYTRCLDCAELGNMNAGIIRRRALEMKPDLEDHYRGQRIPIPGWISSID